MASEKTKAIRRTIKEYLLITLGLASYAFAWVAVILPAKIVGGGISGIALLIYYATGGENGGIPLVYSILGVNMVLIIIASFIIGFTFSTKTIYAVIVMALSMGLFQSIVPPDLLGLAGDKLLSAILGGATAGIGISLCFSQGGSTGGTDIIAMIINKYHQISYGRVIMACDFLIIGASFFIINDGISVVIYSYVVVAATGYTLDAILAGNSQSSQLMIMSQHYNEIAEKIAETGRGVTFLDAEGWYSKKSTKVMMVVCRKNETTQILRIVKEIDEQAFTTVGNVMGVYGKGFEKLNPRGRKSKKKTAA